MCLIPSRIDQKLKKKGRIHGFLKGKLARRSWAIEAVVGAVLKCRGSGLHSAASWPQSRADLALIPLQSEPRSLLIVVTINRQSVHDREAIEPRSWIFLLPFCIETSRRDRGVDSTMEEPRSRLNHVAIAVRSDRDRGVLPRILQAVRLSFR